MKNAVIIVLILSALLAVALGTEHKHLHKKHHELIQQTPEAAPAAPAAAAAAAAPAPTASPAAKPVSQTPEELTKALDDVLIKINKEQLDEWDFKLAYEQVAVAFGEQKPNIIKIVNMFIQLDTRNEQFVKTKDFKTFFEGVIKIITTPREAPKAADAAKMLIAQDNEADKSVEKEETVTENKL